MAFKVFLDANVILDFALKRTAYEQGKMIIAWIEGGKITGFVSPTVIQIASYWIAKAYGVAKAKEIITALLASVRTVDTPHEVVLQAFHSSMQDMEDALLYYTALYHGMDYVVSQDRAFQRVALPSLPVISPSGLINLGRSFV